MARTVPAEYQTIASDHYLASAGPDNVLTLLSTGTTEFTRQMAGSLALPASPARTRKCRLMITSLVGTRNLMRNKLQALRDVFLATDGQR